MNLPVGLILEGVVATLLVATICYCYVLSRKLERLRESQGDLRKIIAQLIGATKNAEAAISGLKATADETDIRLTEKLTKARSLIEELSALAIARQANRTSGGLSGTGREPSRLHGGEPRRRAG